MALADGVSFIAASAGTGAFVYATARASFRTPAQAVSDGSLVNGQSYSYLAQNFLTSPTQREWGHAVFTASSSTFARTPLGGVDNGTDTGAAPVNFSVAPIVSLTVLAEDFVSGLTVGSTTVTGGTDNYALTVGGGLLGNAAIRTILSNNVNYYVSTIGSDSNNGSIGAPWATLQHAVDVIAALDVSTFIVTVNIANGTYDGVLLFSPIASVPAVISGYVNFVGNVADNTAVVVLDTNQNGDCVSIYDGSWLIQHLTCEIQTVGNAGIEFQASGAVAFTSDIIFNNTSGGDAWSGISYYNDFNSLKFDFITWIGGYQHGVYFGASFCETYGAGRFTFSGTPNFSSAFVWFDGFGIYDCGAGTTTGASTGVKYHLDHDSIIDGWGIVGGTGLPSLGGNAAGTNIYGTYTSELFALAVQKNGLPANTDMQAGSWAVFKDTGGGGVYLAYNDAGTIKKVALT